MKRILLLILLVSIPLLAAPSTGGLDAVWASPDSTYTPGRQYFGRNNYIEYVAGNSPIIVLVPYAATLDHTDEIPIRKNSVNRDAKATLEVSKILLDTMLVDRGRYPHLVICHLRSKECDVNADSATGTALNPYALRAWQEFHAFAAIARNKVRSQFGKGLVVELVMHERSYSKVDVGFLLEDSVFTPMSASKFNGGSLYLNSSLRHFFKATPRNKNDVLRGYGALGSLIRKFGAPHHTESTAFRSFPGVNEPVGDGNYNPGGFNVTRYGSLNGGTISAVSVSIENDYLDDWSNQRRDTFIMGKVLYAALKEFIRLHLRLTPSKITPKEPSSYAPKDSLYTPGRSYFGRHGYVEYIAGNSPVILGVPHDRQRWFYNLNEIPDRAGKYTYNGKNYYAKGGKDTYTRITALAFRDEMAKSTGRYPHVIINHLPREKVDLNRDSIESTHRQKYGMIVWKEFHGFVDLAKRKVAGEFGTGQYIDLHGHIQQPPYIHWGYNLGNSTLEKSDSALDAGTSFKSSSIRHLAESSPHSFSRLLRGDRSLSHFMSEFSYASVPSLLTPSMPDVVYDENGDVLTPGYFSGDYNSRRHGSSKGGSINSVQVETPYELKKGGRHRDFGIALATAAARFMRYTYGFEFMYPEGTAIRSFGKRSGAAPELSGSLLARDRVIKLDLSGMGGGCRLSLFSLRGQKISETVTAELSIAWRVPPLHAGMYVLAIEDAFRRHTRLVSFVE